MRFATNGSACAGPVAGISAPRITKDSSSAAFSSSGRGNTSLMTLNKERNKGRKRTKCRDENQSLGTAMTDFDSTKKPHCDSKDEQNFLRCREIRCHSNSI